MAMILALIALFLFASCSEAFRFHSPVRGVRLFHSQINISPSILQCKKEINIYENEEVIVDLDDTENDLALETFKELALNSNSVSVQAFLEWEDIKEVMSRGYIDKETIGIIMKEVGIKSGFLDFAQFKEMVDMVNHVNAALEQNELEGLDDDADDEEGEGEADSFFPPGDDDDDDTMKWLDKQLKS